MLKLLYVLTILLLSLGVSAQGKSITGKVTDEQNQPVSGASVSVKGTNTATQTATDGSFVITVPNSSSVLIISYVGMEIQEIQVGDQTSITLSLRSNSATLNEVVVVGYMTERKKDLKGAVAVVKMNEALKETNANLLASLQGRIAGVNITTDGAPGTGTVVNIRGISSILGDIQPLYIVDGVPTKDINALSFCPERWVRGLNQQFAKLSYALKRTGGSNPPFSARSIDGPIAQLDRASAF